MKYLAFFLIGILMSIGIAVWLREKPLGAVSETALLSLIETKQIAYYETHGKYFQGKRTSNEIPADGLEVTPDLLNDKPSYQAENWNDFIPITKLPYVLEIHQYQGPLGDGYQIFLTKKVAGRELRKSIGYGPEAASRTYDWTVIEP